ncbi:MAG: hypothetical protein LBC68_11735, partial [Prevotellaceae bacterium]|nr:hypothetical protein [Prevotellaceae bacterium]
GYPDNFVTKILCLSGGEYLVGFYGGGVVKSIKPFRLVDRKLEKTRFNIAPIFSVTKKDFAKLPSPIRLPTAEELRAMYYKLKKIYRQSNEPKILALNDDWRTQGDWIDRYGNHSAVLCAQAGGGLDFFGGYFSHELKSKAWIGRTHPQKNDQIRRWVHWVESNDRRVLQCLQLGGRKQSEWEDRKESYPMLLDGPHVCGTFKIPPGKYLLSIYFFNKDGHDGKNRLRDYTISVKTMKLKQDVFENLGNKNADVEVDFLNVKFGGTSRVKNFWGGVYKRFYIQVQADEYVSVRIDAACSFNTIVSGFFFDFAGEMQSLSPDAAPTPQQRSSTNWAEILDEINPEYWWCILTMEQILCIRDINTTWFYKNSREILLTAIRKLVNFNSGLPHCTKEINETDKEAIRVDVAKLLANCQLFNSSERVDYTNRKNGIFWWESRTRLGRIKSENFEWNYFEYLKFIKKQKKNQSW